MQRFGISMRFRSRIDANSLKFCFLRLGILVSGAIACSLAIATPALAVEQQERFLIQGAEPAITRYSSPITKLIAQAGDRVGIVQVTGVTLNPTETGIEILLATPNSNALEPVTFSVGKTYIANIPNAVLSLPQGKEFRGANPTNGIASVSVKQATPNSVRVTVVGVVVSPQVELYDSPDEGLVLSLIPAASPQQPQTQPSPEEPAAQTDEPIEIIVTGEQDRYRVPNATTGTKTDTLLRDIPQSIQVVPRQVIEDQKATQLGDAVRNVSGVSPGSPSLTSFANQFIIRGFQDIGENIFVNGIRRTAQGLPLNTATLEQVEVLKGPASVLFGQAEPGGIINVVTKQPLTKPYYAADFTIGNYDFYRPTLDISGPLNADKTILYRLNTAYQSSGSFVDFVELERFLLSPTISFQLGEDTNLTLEGEYYSNSIPDYDGLPAVGTVLTNPFGRVPRSRFLDDPNLEHQHHRVSTLGYRLQHKFSERWSVRNAFKIANTFDLSSYVRTDAAIFYRRENWQVALNQNLFDVDYFEDSRGRNNVFYGAPFTVLGTVSVNF